MTPYITEHMKKGLVGSIWAICMLLPVATDKSTVLNIGAVADRSQMAPINHVTKFSHNVSVLWYHVDMNEVFHVYHIVRVLDELDDVGLIVLFDINSSMLSIPQALETRNKPLVKWGEKTPRQQVEVLTNSDMCGDALLSSLLYGDPYCLTDINVTSLGSRNEHADASKAIVRLVEKLTWKYLFLIHENATEKEAAQLVDRLSDQGVMVVIYNIDLVNDLHATLLTAYDHTVRTTSEINFVVVCQFRCARKVFRTANNFDAVKVHQKTLLKQISRWLVTVYGHSQGVARALKACADDLDNVVILAIPEFNGTGTDDFLDSLESLMMDLRLRETDRLMTDTKAEYIINGLKQKATSWNPAKQCKGYRIETLLWTNDGRGFSTVGYMEAVSGRVVLKSDLFPNTQYGYNKRRFLISTLSYAPFVKKKTNNGTTIYEGFCFDLFNELARTLNFTYDVTEPADQKWGAVEEGDNLTFNGLFGQLQREEIDMVVAPVSIQALREEVSDFAYPFYYEYSTVLLKKPHPNTFKWKTLINPFKLEVLLSILIALPAVTVLAFFLEKYNPYYDIPEHSENRTENGGLHHLHNAFWYMYGALLCQGGVHLPESIAGRTFISAWWIFCIIVVGTYCGNLIAFLTVSKEPAPFNTLAEMIDMKDEYKWGTIGGSFWVTTFYTSKTSDYKKIGEGLKEFVKDDPSILDLSVNNHVNKVKKGGYAWIGDLTSIQTAMQTECDLMTIKEQFFPMIYAIAFTNNSPHTRIFSDKMLKIQESGLLRIWQRAWWPKKNFCARDTVEAKPISLVDVQSAFYVCGIGIFCGFLVLLCEVAISRYQRSKISSLSANPVMIYKTNHESIMNRRKDNAHCNGNHINIQL